MRFTLFAVAIVAALAPATEAVSLNQIDTMFAQTQGAGANSGSSQPPPAPAGPDGAPGA